MLVVVVVVAVVHVIEVGYSEGVELGKVVVEVQQVAEVLKKEVEGRMLEAVVVVGLIALMMAFEFQGVEEVFCQ